jgi:SWI/SNF-related matrix-associated actin-dependent regulator 1 of chromatin subfamily A
MPLFSLLPHQRTGVDFLKSSVSHALLFDEQRVGKTGQAIVAAGELGLKRVLVVTTVAGVGVWKHQIPQWDRYNIHFEIVPWSQIVSGGKYAKVLAQHYDLIIFDESHYGKNPTAQRTQRAFGRLYGDKILQHQSLASHANRVWCLTGTPMSHDPSDLFVTLKALFPHVLLGSYSVPDVSTYARFRARYCVVELRKYGRQLIPVVVRGQNTGELNRRIKPYFLRRRQSDVGIQPAYWDQLFFPLTPKEKDELEGLIDQDAMEAALARGDWAAVERNLARMRRVTGAYKAHATVDAAKEYFATYPDKLVIAYWHTAVGTLLEEGLAKFNPVRVDGSVTGLNRTIRVEHFRNAPHCRVFLAQIAACGEAIDLSASSEMWFAESVFTPSQMAQMGARITNLAQPKQCLVRVITLEDTIDEMIQGRLVDLSRTIAHTLGETYAENFTAR